MAQSIQVGRCLILAGALLLVCAARGWADGRGPGPASTAQPTPESDQLAIRLKVGHWIWTTNFADKQVCRLWRSFNLSNTNIVRKAMVRITADNQYRLFLDGREIGQGANWKSLTDYDVTGLLTPGLHVLGVEAFNDGLEGGVIGGLLIEFANGEEMSLRTDKSWLVAPERGDGWLRLTHPAATWASAKEVAAAGQYPWLEWPFTIQTPPPLRPIDVRFWQTAWFQITLFSIAVVAVMASLRLTAKLAVQSKAQELLRRERARIARDIHDDVGAGLTQLVLQAEVAQTEFPEGSGARAKFDELSERGRAVSHALEEVVWVVNSKRDTLQDFSSYICKYAQAFLRDTPIRCRLDVESDLPEAGLDLAVRRGLLLAAKEALNNAAKYSGATELHVRVHQENNTLRVVVEDNGAGFDANLAGTEGNGLANMQQRLAELGGQCRVLSELGAGCRVEFEVSLAVESRNRWWNWLWRFKWVKKSAQRNVTATDENSSGATDNLSKAT